jgi:hypothetical protein
VSQISAVAVNARGDALVVWRTDRGFFARIRTAGGTLSRAERLGDRGEPVRAISAVLRPDRAAAVVWEAQAVSEGDPESAATVGATFKAAGARHHFHASQRLATMPQLSIGQYVSGRAVRGAVGTDGRITAAWTAYEDGRFVVRAPGLSGFRFSAGRRCRTRRPTRSSPTSPPGRTALWPSRGRRASGATTGAPGRRPWSRAARAGSRDLRPRRARRAGSRAPRRDRPLQPLDRPRRRRTGRG